MELPKQHNSRGSPTLLIRCDDIEGMETPENPDLSCRIYHSGLLSVENIKEKIKNFID